MIRIGNSVETLCGKGSLRSDIHQAVVVRACWTVRDDVCGVVRNVVRRRTSLVYASVFWAVRNIPRSSDPVLL